MPASLLVSAPTSDATSEIERLFDLALGYDHGDRAAFLDRACRDPAVRREVESLLLADEQAGGFLELPVLHDDAPDGNTGDAAGARIGPYRLLRKLGEGETSSVHLAVRDDDQYRQHVAIKVMRPGMDSRQILQRFHRERQILASLNHPHIARLLDGGSTAAGQPYFVMEYVDGQPLDVHCQQANLSLARRLELFRLVCQAVHFAHRNLVVHRDLKPGNILVDADGAPKLLDFGIAKLLDPDRVGIRVEPTATVARLMTPHYASPEQVQGKPVSTASDVYSLGVILYKLLTGRRPYELGSQSLHEIERVVCESTPPSPSRVLRARRRDHEPARGKPSPGHRLPRDLDNVVLMAMRKEPERRYASAQELADDVRRCLEHRPVLARRDTLGYRAASFVRRNAGAVAAAMVIALSLLGGAVATTWQWRRAVAERTRAETQRMTAEHTRNFVVQLFKGRDSSGRISSLTALQLLKLGAERLRAESSRPPEVYAALAHTLGVVYRNLGDYQQAAVLLEQAVAVRAALPDASLDLAESLYQLAAIEADNGKIELADSFLRRALAIRTELLGPDDLAVADVLESLARNIGYHVPVQEGEVDFRRALEIRRRHFGDGDPRLIPSIAELADLYSFKGRYPEADALVQQAMAIRGPIVDGSCRPDDATLLSAIGTLRYREGLFRDAERYTDAATACLERALGPDHAEVVDLMIIRILAECEQGQYAKAEQLARRFLELRRAQHSDKSPAIDNALAHLAHVLLERDQLDEAERLAADALDRRRSEHGRVHTSVTTTLALLGGIRLAGGDAKAAEISYRDALASWPPAMGSDHPTIAEAMRGLAEALVAQGRLGEARAMAEHALALQQQRLRPGHPAIAATVAVLGTIAQVESPAAAEPMFREALAIWRAALGAEHPHVARAESLLGECLALQGKAADALPLLRRSARTLRAQLGDDHRETRLARKRLQAAEPPSRE